MKKLIYKYYKINTFLYDVLISNQLYFSTFNQFNDPYDCYMTFFEKVTEEDFKVYLKGLKLSEEIVQKYLKAFSRKPDEFVKPFIDAYKGWINHYGICCFTKGKENILLWSHYADSHKGVCLGFDYDLMIKKFTQYDDVEYSSEPFYFDLKNSETSVAKTILRKSIDWKYEDEVRFVMERSKTIDFYQDALLEVNFGTRCPDRDKMNIQHLVSKMNYRNCQFNNAFINEREYKVQFETCNLEELKKSVLEKSIEKRFEHTIDLKHLLDDSA